MPKPCPLRVVHPSCAFLSNYIEADGRQPSAMRTRGVKKIKTYLDRPKGSKQHRQALEHNMIEIASGGTERCTCEHRPYSTLYEERGA